MKAAAAERCRGSRAARYVDGRTSKASRPSTTTRRYRPRRPKTSRRRVRRARGRSATWAKPRAFAAPCYGTPGRAVGSRNAKPGAQLRAGARSSRVATDSRRIPRVCAAAGVAQQRAGRQQIEISAAGQTFTALHRWSFRGLESGEHRGFAIYGQHAPTLRWARLPGSQRACAWQFRGLSGDAYGPVAETTRCSDRARAGGRHHAVRNRRQLRQGGDGKTLGLRLPAKAVIVTKVGTDLGATPPRKRFDPHLRQGQRRALARAAEARRDRRGVAHNPRRVPRNAVKPARVARRRARRTASYGVSVATKQPRAPRYRDTPVLNRSTMRFTAASSRPSQPR